MLNFFIRTSNITDNILLFAYTDFPVRVNEGILKKVSEYDQRRPLS